MSRTWGNRLALGGIVVAGLLGRPTLADDTPDLTQRLGQLSDEILLKFPYVMPAGAKATAGGDWCYHVEVDRTRNWWEFQTKGAAGQITFNPTRDAARIRMIFTSKNKSSGFASIFLGLDAPGGSSYSFDNAQAPSGPDTPASSVDGAQTSAAAGGQPSQTDAAQSSSWQEPQGAKITLRSDTCMPLPDFLRAWLLDLLGKSPIFPADPTLDPANSGTTGLLPNKQEGSALETSPFFWNFNGSNHRIAYAFRVLLKIPGQTTPVYLTVGYGGNSGAG